MRSLLTALALASAFFASSASAQVRFLPYVGYAFGGGYDFEEFESTDPGDDLPETGGFLVGVGVEFPVTPGFLPIAIKIRPSAETAFMSGYEEGDVEASQNSTQINLDVVADFSPPLAPLGIFAGAGAAYAMYNAEVKGDLGGGTTVSQEIDDSAFGLNLFAGARFGGGFIQPFVQGRYTMMTLQPGEDELPEGDEYPEESEISPGLSIHAGVSIGL
jgi:opacity protein-like surface antigen